MGFFYSTEFLSPADKTAFWHDSVGKRLIPAAAKFRDPRGFEGSLSGHALGSLTVCRMKAGAHAFVRTEHLVRAAPEDDFVAAFVQEGAMRISQGGRDVHAEHGGIVLLDSARPFSHDMEENTVLLIRIPRQQLLSRFPRAEGMMGLDIARGSPMGSLLLSMAEEAYRIELSPAIKAAHARFAAALMDTLTAAMEMQFDGVNQGSRHESLYQKAVQHIEANLDNCDLDCDDVAEAVHTSPRTLMRVFAAHGGTVMHHVWKRRLETSFKMLSEKRVDQVSQAAYLCGFNNLSHFSRVFKGTYGATARSLLQTCDETVSN